MGRNIARQGFAYRPGFSFVLVERSIGALKQKLAPEPTNFDAMMAARKRRKLEDIESSIDAVTDTEAQHSLRLIVAFLKEHFDGR